MPARDRAFMLACDAHKAEEQQKARQRLARRHAGRR